MAEDLDRLESEVEALLSGFADALDVAPSEGVVYRVQAAAHLELGEAWLAEQPAPVPSADSLARVRRAVRKELVVPARGGAWWRTVSSLAAAAIIGVCVGIVHHVGTMKPVPQIAQQRVDDMEDLLADAANIIASQDPWAQSVSAGLDAIEESIVQWKPVEDYNTQLLDELVTEIDEILAESEAEQSTSRAPGNYRRAVG